MRLVTRVVCLVLLMGSALRAQTIDATWAVGVGGEALSHTAGVDLMRILQSERGLTLSSRQELGSQRVILVGTIHDNAMIAEAHARKPFRFDVSSPESYHLSARDGNLYIVGATAKGAMNGVFRLLDRPTLNITGLDEARSPVFRHRVGGHKMNQAPPAEWTEEDQARFYARHYINVVWGEKHGAPMSLESRQKYGLGLMVEIRLPPEFGGNRDWMNDAQYASAVYYHAGKEGRRVLDPFDPVGRDMYLKAYRELLEANPDTKILYALFGDYSVIPSPASNRVSDGRSYAHSRVDTMKEIMGILREAIGSSPAKDAVAIAWLWHGFFGEPAGTSEAFMAWLRDNGYGALFNEAGDNDNWLIRRDNFAEIALKTGTDGKVLWGENYYPLVSVGGACESTNPVIAMPLPKVAAHKLSRLVDARVNNMVLWWGSAEGWAYSPNLRVLARAIWEPELLKRQDELLRQIASADFGPGATEMVKYWNRFDSALVTEGGLYQPVDKQPAADKDGLHINDWYQRMGIFTETVFSQEFAKPLTKDALISHEKAGKGTYWGTHDVTLANYGYVLKGLAAAQTDMKRLIDSGTLSPLGREKARQSYLWAELYRTLLTSQHNYLRALRAVHGRADAPVAPDQIDARLRPVQADEIANCQQMITVLEQLPPNANIRQPHMGVVRDQGTTAEEIASLREKIATMRFSGTGELRNLALGKPTTSSSVKTEYGVTFSANLATDGNMETRWASIFRDAEWLAVDLGASQRVDAIRIHWKTAYPSDFEIEIADTPNQWRSIHRRKGGSGGVSLIQLEEPVTTRHVRLKTNKQATAWGYSVTEFEVLGR